jgi:hypothetical protein
MSKNQICADISESTSGYEGDIGPLLSASKPESTPSLVVLAQRALAKQLERQQNDPNTPRSGFNPSGSGL